VTLSFLLTWVKRVEDVNLLRTLQFAEDGGPTAHPVQPSSFMEISNFYTVTIYEKGAEIVRMIHSLLGEENFRQSTDLYFQRHDGQAVTIEDFIAAMADVSGRDFATFLNWYKQAGTPRLTVSGEYSEENRSYRLVVRQNCPSTAQSEDMQPFLVPVRLGLVGKSGDLPLYVKNVVDGAKEVVLEITDHEQAFVFEQVNEQPVPSLLRNFSAPVKLDFPYTRDDLLHLMSRDSDGFNRWEACNRLALSVLQESVANYEKGVELNLDHRLIEAYRELLTDSSLDQAMVALMLTLPTEAYLSEVAEVIDVEAIHGAREHARRAIGQALKKEFMQVYKVISAKLASTKYQANGEQIALRSLKNAALVYLMQSAGEEVMAIADNQLEASNNMTDAGAALSAIVNSTAANERGITAEALKNFYSRWSHEPLVVNLWFQIQALSVLPGGLERVISLLEHKAFDITNPNKVRAVIGSFSATNAINFHRGDGAGYKFLTRHIVALNTLNPQIAARLVTPLTRWRKYPAVRSEAMKAELETLLAQPDLSRDVYEIVKKSL
jgi:aminopeptidase N